MKSVLAKSIFIAITLLFGNIIHAGEPSRHITVYGDAEIRIAPDEIILTVGVETLDPELQTAKTENDRLIKAAVAAARGHGIPDKHIKTDYINIQPVYDTYNQKRTLLHYQVRKSIVFTLREIEKFDGLLTDLLDAGVNNVIGVDFRTTDLRNQRDFARSQALRAAREKAEDMAREYNRKLGPVISITENRSGYYPWYGSSWYGWGNRGMSQNVIQNVGGGDISGSTLAPGQISITANVTVSFALE